MQKKTPPNSWSVAAAAAWAGIPVRTLYKLLASGEAPCLRLGDSYTQQMSRARRRRRACARYIIPRVAFVAWWENFAASRAADNNSNALPVGGGEATRC